MSKGQNRVVTKVMISGNDKVVLSVERWSELLELAKKAGWQPAGTRPPQSRELSGQAWDGDYNSPRGQEISPEDGWSLCKALFDVLNAQPEPHYYDQCGLPALIANLIQSCGEVNILACK